MGPHPSPPTLLGIPAELRAKVYECLFSGDDLRLRIYCPAHPGLTLLRACKQIYREARPTVIQSMKLRILHTDEPYSSIPRQMREAYFPYVQAIYLNVLDFIEESPNMDFLAHAQCLRQLHIGKTSLYLDMSVSEMYDVAINTVGAQPRLRFGPAADWDTTLLHFVLYICGCAPGTVFLDPDPDPLWLYSLIANKQRRFALHGSLLSQFTCEDRLRGLPQTIVHISFDFDTLQTFERKVWATHFGDLGLGKHRPLLTVQDARDHVFGNIVPELQKEGYDTKNDGAKEIWIGNFSSHKFP